MPAASSARSRRAEVVLVAAFFAIVVAVFLWPVVFAGEVLLPLDLVGRTEPWRSELPGELGTARNFLISDAVWETYPMAVDAARAVRNGELLWDEKAMSGTPTWASGKMYSNPLFHILALFMSPARAMSLAAVAHLFLASFFLYLLLREMEVAPPAATVGALAFGFNGYLIGWLSLTYCTGTMVWTPVVAWCLERAQRRRDRRWLAAAAAAFAVQVFAGYVLFAFYSALALGSVYALRSVGAAWRRRPLREALRPTLWAGTALVLGAALGGVLLVPSAELFAQSNRVVLAGGNSFLRIDDMVRLVAPGISGSPVDGDVYQGPFNYSETDLYFGIVPLLGVAAVVWSSRRCSAAPFLLVGGTFYFAVLDVFPIRQAVTLLVPLFTSTFPGRIFFVVAFCGAVAAGLGVDAALRERRARRAAVVAALALIVGCAVCWIGLRFAVAYRYPEPEWLLRAIAFTAVAALIFGLATGSARRWTGRWPGIALVVLLLVDLVPTGIGYNPSFPESKAFPRTTSVVALEELQADAGAEGARLLSVISSFVLPGMSPGVYGLDSLSGYSSWLLRRYTRYMELTGDGKVGGNMVSFHGCCSPLLDAAGAEIVLTAAHTPLPVPSSPEDLLGWFGVAEIEAVDYPALTRWTIDGDERSVLYQHPPSRILLPVGVGGGELFRAALAVDPRAWELGGDGLRFGLRARCGDGHEVDILSQEVHPAVNEAHRRWLPVEVRLPEGDACRSPIDLVLLTWPGKSGNRYFDWGGWAEPRLEGLEPRLEMLREGPNAIYRNRAALRRARLVHRVHEVPRGDVEAAAAILASGEVDLATAVVVEGTLAAEPAMPPVPGTARLIGSSSHRVEVETQATHAGLLVLSDVFYPGWCALLDGEPVPILATNIAFRGVAVPAGRHRVVFEYRPASVRIGAGVSLLALLVGLALLLVPGRGRGGS